jgi:hypothetical protein
MLSSNASKMERGTCTAESSTGLLRIRKKHKKYPGEYIAIVGESIVAHGKDFKAVLAAAESQTGQEPFIYKVPLADREVVV